MFPDFINRANVGMVQCGSCSRLAAETFQSLRILCYVVWQEFQSDEAAKVAVFGLIHHSHSAAAQFLDDSIVRNGLPKQ